MAERVFIINELDGGFMSAKFSDGKGCTTIITTAENLPKQVEARMEKGDMFNFDEDMDAEAILEFAGGIRKVKEERRMGGVRFRREYSV